MLDIFQVSSVFADMILLFLKTTSEQSRLHDRIRSIYKFRRIGKLWITHSSCLFDMAFKHTLLIVNPLESQSGLGMGWGSLLRKYLHKF